MTIGAFAPCIFAHKSVNYPSTNLVEALQRKVMQLEAENLRLRTRLELRGKDLRVLGEEDRTRIGSIERATVKQHKHDQEGEGGSTVARSGAG